MVITKTIKSFPNLKTWMTEEVKALSRAKKAAFRSGDKEAYSTTTVRLKPSIKEAKRRHQERLERQATGTHLHSAHHSVLTTLKLTTSTSTSVC